VNSGTPTATPASMPRRPIPRVTLVVLVHQWLDNAALNKDSDPERADAFARCATDLLALLED
jgi:hypothetical protein